MLRIADETGGDVGRSLRIAGIAHRAGQDDVVVDRFGADAGARNEAADRAFEDADVAFDLHFQRQDLLAVGVEEEDVGLADLLADDIGASGRPDHRVGGFGIGDQHVGGRPRQFDDERFRQTELDLLRRAPGDARVDRLLETGLRQRVRRGDKGADERHHRNRKTRSD